jgi:hypothetical protein
MNYEINIMENDEFDALPYKHAKTALGMADASTGKAYIRRTGVAELDAGTIRHEFDELLQKVSPHEEDGIRYKSGGALGKILAPVLGIALAPFTGGASAALLGAGLTAGTGAFSRAKKPEKYGRNSFGNILKDAAIGGASAFGGHALGTGGISGFKAADPGFFSKAAGTLKGAVGLPVQGAGTRVGTSGGAGQLAGQPSSGLGARFAQAANPSNAQLLAGGGGPGGLPGLTPSAFGASARASIAGANPSLTQKLASFGRGAIKSGGQQLAGNALISTLAPPQATAISGAGFGEGTTAGGPVQSGQNVLGIFGNQPAKAGSGEFQNPFSQEDFDEGLARINQQSTRQTGDVFDAFRRSQPGQSIEGSSAFANQLAAVEQGNIQNQEQFTQQTNQANEQAFQQFRYDGVKNANGLSDAKMQEYIRLSKQPDNVIKSQFPGMSPSGFREIFQGLDSFA